MMQRIESDPQLLCASNGELASGDGLGSQCALLPQLHVDESFLTTIIQLQRQGYSFAWPAEHASTTAAVAIATCVTLASDPSAQQWSGGIYVPLVESPGAPSTAVQTQAACQLQQHQLARQPAVADTAVEAGPQHQMVQLPLNTGSGRDRQQQQQHCCSMSSPDRAVDQAAAADLCATKRSINHKSSRDSGWAQGLAAASASAALHGEQDSQLAVAANSKLQQEMEDLQRLQAELQSAAECVGIQGLQLTQTAAAASMQPQNSISTQHRLAPDDDGPALLASKRQKTVPSTKQLKRLAAAQQASAAPSAAGTTAALAANSRLQHELEDLQRLQAELQSAAECLGIQLLQPTRPAAAAAAPMQPQDSICGKHALPSQHATEPSKRQRLEEQQGSMFDSAAVTASGIYGRYHPPLLAQQQEMQQQQDQFRIRSWSPINELLGRRLRAPPVSKMW